MLESWTVYPDKADKHKVLLADIKQMITKRVQFNSQFVEHSQRTQL